MGVVRRTGDWRLEKREEGVYEITFRHEPQLRVLTPTAPAYERNAMMLETAPIQEVGSYSEAEGLFEERAHGPPPRGMRYSSEEEDPGSSDNIEWLKLPAGVLGLILIVVGILFLLTFVDSGNTIGLTIGLFAGGAGVLPYAYAGYVIREKGWREGISALVTPTEDLVRGGYARRRASGPEDDPSETSQTTQPVPQNLKNELFFERAERHCEYCDRQFDQLHIHHIKPRRDGGPNTAANLIVLCPNCHSQADSGAISRSKLRYKVREKKNTKAMSS